MGLPVELLNRTLIIGDVHGCLDEFELLLQAAGVETTDRVILAGDLVAKGPDSAGVVQLARERAFLSVLGNHDAHLLKARTGAAVGPDHAAIAQLLQPADWAYLESLPTHLRLPEFFTIVVHAGLVPGVPLERQARHHVLNLRSFDATGEPVTSARGTPWAERWPGPELVVFGHDAMRGLQQHPHAIGLDTGCVYGKRLTALWLPERRLVSVPAKRIWRAID
jgi:hypothetical protein